MILSYLSSSGVILILLTVQFSKSRCIDSFYRLPLLFAFVKNFFYLFLKLFSVLSFLRLQMRQYLYYISQYSLCQHFFLIFLLLFINFLYLYYTLNLLLFINIIATIAVTISLINITNHSPLIPKIYGITYAKIPLRISPRKIAITNAFFASIIA